VYLPQSRIGHIEIKTGTGSVSTAQRQRHNELRALGHDVRVLAANTPGAAADQAEMIVMDWLNKEAAEL
jgi:ABC-type lipoprotein export system ATPase subunit